MERIESLQKGASYPAVSDKDVKSGIIPIPPLLEQKQIVSILDKAFAAIDQAKANIEKNIQNAEELFQSKLNEVFSQKGEGWEDYQLKSLIEYDKTKHDNTSLPYIGLEDIESDTGKHIGTTECREVKSTTFRFDERHVLYGRLRFKQDIDTRLCWALFI